MVAITVPEVTEIGAVGIKQGQQGIQFLAVKQLSKVENASTRQLLLICVVHCLPFVHCRFATHLRICCPTATSSSV